MRSCVTVAPPPADRQVNEGCDEVCEHEPEHAPFLVAHQLAVIPCATPGAIIADGKNSSHGPVRTRLVRDRARPRHDRVRFSHPTPGEPAQTAHAIGEAEMIVQAMNANS